ncbi:cation transporter [Devosia psychrophila]|uniref:Cation transporter n=1 Tax=Devosia psychrophila TaxID=728005 RepID=A0ABR5DU85_9HYPH|nr:efflux RND transporter periplasmic adaptor subunit [Devosia psychrophila]KKC31570.1 cation transporter [Devosia psychrophila]
MNTKVTTGLALVAITAAGLGGYLAGQQRMSLPFIDWIPEISLQAAETPTASAGPVIYYRHPDGLPSYSATPKATDDGRPFTPVQAGDDVSFEEKPDVVAEVATGESRPPSGARRLLYYRHPMGLPDTSPTPKKDSMGMDYLPVYEGNADESGVVVAAGKMQRTGVRSEVASSRIIVRTIRVPGAVEFDERLVTVVASRSDAFVDRVADVTTGDRVNRGEPLLWLYSAEVSSAGAQYLTALKGGGDGAEGARQRLLNLGVAPAVIATIKRDGEIPMSTVWPAPRDGVVVERNVVEGMAAQSGDVLFRLVDLSSVWIIADVPEYDLDVVRVGASVDVSIRSLPGKTFSGRIALIYPGVAAETRTTKVRIEIANPDLSLLPGMYADVGIVAGSPTPVLSVSDSAVIDTGTRRTVILDLGDGRFGPREVKTGLQGDGFTEILTGIATGDRVVVSANFLIDAESNLKAALDGMAAVQGANP